MHNLIGDKVHNNKNMFLLQLARLRDIFTYTYAAINVLNNLINVKVKTWLCFGSLHVDRLGLGVAGKF